MRVETQPDVLTVRLRHAAGAIGRNVKVEGQRGCRVVIQAREDADRIRVRRPGCGFAASGYLTCGCNTCTHTNDDRAYGNYDERSCSHHYSLPWTWAPAAHLRMRESVTGGKGSLVCPPGLSPTTRRRTRPVLSLHESNNENEGEETPI